MPSSGCSAAPTSTASSRCPSRRSTRCGWGCAPVRQPGVVERYFPEGAGVTRRQDAGRYLRINGTSTCGPRPSSAAWSSWFDEGRHAMVEIPESRAFAIDYLEELEDLEGGGRTRPGRPPVARRARCDRVLTDRSRGTMCPVLRADLERTRDAQWDQLRSYLLAYAARQPVERVAVVGNAPLHPDAGRAATIDAADLVIRVNAFVLDEPGSAPTVGTACHAVLLSRATTITPWTLRDHRERATSSPRPASSSTGPATRSASSCTPGSGPRTSARCRCPTPS